MSTGKLVRDKIPQIIKQNDGINPKVRILNNEEYYTELKTIRRSPRIFRKSGCFRIS